MNLKKIPGPGPNFIKDISSWGNLRRIVHLKSEWSPKFWVNHNFDINLILNLQKEIKKHIFLTFFYKIKDSINLKLKTAHTFMIGPWCLYVQKVLVHHSFLEHIILICDTYHKAVILCLENLYILWVDHGGLTLEGDICIMVCVSL